jgi:hypothetical protein
MFNCLVFYCGNPYNSPWRADLSEPAQTAQLLRQTTHRSKINGIPHDVSIEIHLLNNCSNYFLCYASLLGLLWFSRQIRGFYAKSLDLNEICRKKGTLHFQPIPNVSGEFAFFDCSSFFDNFPDNLGKGAPCAELCIGTKHGRQSKKTMENNVKFSQSCHSRNSSFYVF